MLKKKHPLKWLQCHGGCLSTKWPIIDALSSTKYDDQRIARDLPVKLLMKLEVPMILDMMLQLYYTNSPYVIAIFTDHSNYDTISNISKDIYEVLK